MSIFTFSADPFQNINNQQPLIGLAPATHVETQWQLATSSDFDPLTIVDDTWFDTNNLLSIDYDLDTSLGITYYVHSRFRDSYGAVSLWSAAVTVVPEPAPPRPTATRLARRFVFFGRLGDNAIMLADSGLLDQELDYELLLRTNMLSPAGLGGECLFTAFFLKTYHLDGQILTVTPIVDGLRLPDVTVTLTVENQPVTTVTEIGIYKAGSPRVGVRGASVQIEISAVLPLTDEWLEFHGCDVEYVQVREAYPMITPTAVLTQAPQITNKRILFAGEQGGNRMGHFADGRDDFGLPVVARVETNEVAPAGEGGECIFTYAYLVVTRANTSTLTLLVTPIVDNVEYDTQTVTLAAVTDLVTSVTELRLHHEPTGRVRVALRGQWIKMRIETDGNLPDGDVWLEGVEVEFEQVTETRPQRIGV